jgi:SAM-dependent methyltransferase
MKKYLYFKTREEKIELIVNIFPEIFKEDSVLDVGCGDSYLKKFISGKYIGIDKYGNPDIQSDISNGLPFQDKSFDTVVAFDVLEHIDNIHFLFDELCRVSKKWVIITLPNMYEIRFRISFLLGRHLSGKYILSENPPLDRHRWLFSLNEAINFIKRRAEINNFEIFKQNFFFYKYNKFLPKIITKIGLIFGQKFQNILVDHYLAVLRSE